MIGPTTVCDGFISSTTVADISSLSAFGQVAIYDSGLDQWTIYSCENSYFLAQGSLLTVSDTSEISGYIFVMFAIAFGVKYVRGLLDSRAVRE